MKKKIGLKIFIPMIIALIVVIPMLVSGKDYGVEYDKIFGKEEGFTIHTNELEELEEINDYQLMSAVQKFTSNLSTNTLYEGDSAYYFRPSILECSAQDMTCDIIVQKVIDKGNWNYDYQEFKSYDDIKININSDVMNYFGTVLNSNGDMIINYDEAMFSDVNEKSEYISNYISSKQFTNSDGYNVSFFYEAPSNAITYTINDYSRGDFTNVFTARARVKSVQFNSNEMPYTENYKKLTADGTLTIKSNAPITREILSDYLNNVHISVGGSYLSFNVDGKVVDGKAYVKMMQYGSDNELEWSENHLLTLVQDDKIDNNIFNMIGMKDVITIPADRPENELTSYIQYYFSGMQYKHVNLDDDNNTYYSFDYVYSSDGGVPEVVKFVKYVNGNAEDVQFNKISYNFIGYSDTYSDKFAGKYKNGMVVRADSLDFWAVSNNLDSGYSLLACNSDISVCDIALSHNEEKRMEIHKVNITLDDSISERFKNVFNINDDGTIDILTDVDLNGLPYVSYYAYDEENDSSYVYTFEGNKIRLELNPYSTGDYEKHTVPFNKVNNGITDYFKNNVYMSKDFYPGENTNFWNYISHNYYFSKNKYGHNANTIGCDRDSKKCKVILLNDSNKLEIHEVQANIKEGKSPAFASAFPDKKVVFNAIYKDDEQYLYGASQAYFMSKTKDYIYLNSFTEDTARVVFNELEVHSFDVEYTEANEKHAEEIEKAKKNLKNTDLTTIRRDLEFVNRFYYNHDDNLLSSSNFNSKSLNEKFNKAVKNKHIGYYVVPEGGGGMPFMNGAAGRLVLFYDGVAYDILDGYVDFTNYSIVYIPSNTKATPEEYVKAAQKRVDEYLGKDSGVVISYTGKIDEEMFDDSMYDALDINKNTFDNNEYQISYQNKTAMMLIIADSSKMQKPDFAASDVTENINVTSETVNYPSNTVVMSEVIDQEDSEYSKILDKAKVKNAHVVDINLYSTTVGDIDDFDGAKFNVSVPIQDKDLQGKELVAYYIDDKGNVEEHPVVMDEFMANFETTHFSTYIIAEKVKSDKLEDAAQDVIKNPNTGDNILTYVLLLILSGLVVGVTSYKFIKREN